MVGTSQAATSLFVWMLCHLTRRLAWQSFTETPPAIMELKWRAGVTETLLARRPVVQGGDWELRNVQQFAAMPENLQPFCDTSPRQKREYVR